MKKTHVHFVQGLDGQFYTKKAEEFGCNKLALGHHFDDIVETVMMNMFYSGTIKTMLPKVKSNSGKFDLIRPLVYVHEEDIAKYVVSKKIPIMKCGCRMYTEQKSSKRLDMKILLKKLERETPDIKQSIFSAIGNVNLDYIMGYVGKKDENER